MSTASAHHEDFQDVVEQRCDGGEQRQGRGDVLIGAVMVYYIGSVVEDVAGHQHDHGCGEEGAEVKSNEDRDDNQTQGDQAADRQNRRQEGKVLARHEGRDRQTAERRKSKNAGRGNERPRPQYCRAREVCDRAQYWASHDAPMKAPKTSSQL
jgi:hypothetical protein